MKTRQTGLMVIRVWIEKGSSNPLRAEVSKTTDVTTGFTARASLVEVEGVLDEVRAFLASVITT